MSSPVRSSTVEGSDTSTPPSITNSTWLPKLLLNYSRVVQDFSTLQLCHACAQDRVPELLHDRLRNPVVGNADAHGLSL